MKPHRKTQLALALSAPRTHGGRRRGAGRKPRGPRPGVSHHGRPAITYRFPIHVTMRARREVWNLRSRRAFAIIERALAGVLTRGAFRVVHFSVQGNHVHLLVEAQDKASLSTGMQALSVRLARGLNRMMGRSGPVLSDRYHAHVLRTPREVRHALAYVLLNFRSHMARNGERVGRGLDPFSSGQSFDGWASAGATAPPRLTSTPRTWLFQIGWRRHGLISPEEIPALKS